MAIYDKSCTQPYGSFTAMCAALRWMPPKGDRYLIKPFVGTVNGLSNLHGIALASNGPLVALLRNDSGEVVLVHKDWLDQDWQDALDEARVPSSVKAKAKRTKWEDDYV